jgi:hypothetical protein
LKKDYDHEEILNTRLGRTPSANLKVASEPNETGGILTQGDMMGTKQYWDTMSPYVRQANFPDFNPATYGARWHELSYKEKVAVYRHLQQKELKET